MPKNALLFGKIVTSKGFLDPLSPYNVFNLPSTYTINRRRGTVN